jgi:starvation-inducible DNA-binding protein
MQPNIGLSPAQREGVVGILSKLLADEFVLYAKTRNYHWNVTGPRFNDLHKFFESQYDQLDEIIDDTAERARALGGHAIGTLGEYQKLSRLKEHPGDYPSADEMIKNLHSDHETVIRQLRTDLVDAQEKCGDAGTADFLTGLMETHEKMAWMLRSFASE